MGEIRRWVCLIISSPACGKSKAKSWKPAPCLQPILVTGTVTPSHPARAACPQRCLPAPFQHHFVSQQKGLELRHCGIQPRSPGVEFSAWFRRFPGDLGTAVSQPAAESVTQPQWGSVHGAGKANADTAGPLCRDKPQLHLAGEETERGKRKAGSLWSGCPNKDQDKPSLLMEMLFISVGNHIPEGGVGETPCAGTRFANEGKLP